MRTIFILGSKGMLGRYCYKYLKQNHKVKTVNRDILDASEMTEETLEMRLNFVGVKKDDVIINCMGTIKPMVEQIGELKTIMVNSVFPRLLADYGEKNGVHIIHPTTDCVYDGARGNYTETDRHTPNDFYGFSKLMGEPKNCTVIRTSIIGEEVGQGRSLIEWAKSSRGKEVNGFNNHHWNGVTCLEFAKICEHIITNDLYWNGVKHVTSPKSVSKEELLSMLNNTFELNLSIKPVEADFSVDRTLSTVQTPISNLHIPTLTIQIEDLKKFSSVLYF